MILFDAHLDLAMNPIDLNARAICDWQRQFSEDQIRFVIERDGVLGESMDVILLQNGVQRE
jgi:membrane dipeptidase